MHYGIHNYFKKTKNSLNLKTYFDLEISIRRLEGKQKEAVVFLGKVGAGIKKENLEKGVCNTYDKVFLILDPEDSISIIFCFLITIYQAFP